ncbi:uncharacterized protein [Antedon mediterranea]|uniref:uncharacterized protein n=1 Tax=Antedon mediterranea TaxID=105859 RepID=UPI003AF80F8F
MENESEGDLKQQGKKSRKKSFKRFFTRKKNRELSRITRMENGAIILDVKDVPMYLELKRRAQKPAKHDVGVNTEDADEPVLTRDRSTIMSLLSTPDEDEILPSLPAADAAPADRMDCYTQCSILQPEEDIDEQSNIEDTFEWTLFAGIASTFVFLLYNMLLQPSVGQTLLVLSLIAHAFFCGSLWVINVRKIMAINRQQRGEPDLKDADHQKTIELDLDSFEKLIAETKRKTVRNVIDILERKGLIKKSEIDLTSNESGSFSPEITNLLQ